MRLFLGRTIDKEGYYEIGRFKTYWRKAGFLKGRILALSVKDFMEFSDTRVQRGELKEIIEIDFKLR